MSSSPLIVLMVLTSFLVRPGGSIQSEKADSVADLLLQDKLQQAELLLGAQPRTAQTLAFLGELEFRKGDFDKAAALYKESLGLDPKTARAHFGLGKLAMTKLQGKQATQAIARAIQLEPQESIYHLYASEAWAIEKNSAQQTKHLEEYLKLNPSKDRDRVAEARAGLELLKSFGAEEIGAVQGPENPAPIRFRKSLNLIFASVMVNGAGPYDFAIDTGASQTVLSEKLAGELGLTPITSTIMHGVGGAGKIDSKLYKLREIGIGDIKIQNVPVGTFNDPLVTQLADGIIGTALLSDFVVTVNYPESQLELTRKKPAAQGEVFGARFFSNLLLIQIQVNSKTRGNFVVDTGAVTTVISHALASELGVTEDTPGAKINLGIAGVGGFEGVVLRVPDVTFQVGKNVEHYPQVVSIDLSQISKMIGTEVAGVIGCDFFESRRLTLDYHAAEVTFGN